MRIGEETEQEQERGEKKNKNKKKTIYLPISKWSSRRHPLPNCIEEVEVRKFPRCGFTQDVDPNNGTVGRNHCCEKGK
jgi:hypothetical protein